MPTIKEWLENAAQHISKSDAELLLLHHFDRQNQKIDRSYFAIHQKDFVPEPLDELNSNLKRRIEKTPLAYILGYKEFYGRKFFMSESTLIPRPETETIIDLVRKLEKPPKHILDIGTGSGCIAITLDLELNSSKVEALDISNLALEIAEKNNKNLGTSVSFSSSNLLENYTGKNPDLIVANLPYVDKTWDWLDHDALDYEPSLALYAKEDGLALIFKLLDQIKERFNHVGVMLESDPSQQEKIETYAVSLGYKKQGREGYITTLSLDF